jgi:hypothetical protein
MIVSNRIDTGSRPHWAEAFGTRVNEIEAGTRADSLHCWAVMA